MTPVAIYARYSTDKQDARSIDDQLRRCREYAKHHDQEVVAEFTDAATSGAHTERINLRRMLDVATATKRPPFKAVIVDDLSRLSRDLGDTWRIIFTDLVTVDIRVIDASTGMASDANGARTMFAAMAMVNDTFLQLVRHETHRGLQGRAIAGFSTGGSLYGFTTFEEENPTDREHPRKMWAIDETEAEVVRRIYRMFDQGSHGYRAIADALNREGVPAPRNNGRGGKHGGGWGHSSVRAILMNEKYIGRWRWNATKWVRVPGRRARRQLQRPESEHVVREYPELAITDRGTWDRIQEKLGRRKERGTHGDALRIGQRTYMLSGLLRCGVWRPDVGERSEGQQRRSLRVVRVHGACVARRFDLPEHHDDQREEADRRLPRLREARSPDAPQRDEAARRRVQRTRGHEDHDRPRRSRAEAQGCGGTGRKRDAPDGRDAGRPPPPASAGG